jgi:hypothetical protein
MEEVTQTCTSGGQVILFLAGASILKIMEVV